MKCELYGTSHMAIHFPLPRVPRVKILKLHHGNRGYVRLASQLACLSGKMTAVGPRLTSPLGEALA